MPDGQELREDDWHRSVGSIKQDILYAFQRQWIAVYLGNYQLLRPSVYPVVWCGAIVLTQASATDILVMARRVPVLVTKADESDTNKAIS